MGQALGGENGKTPHGKGVMVLLLTSVYSGGSEVIEPAKGNLHGTSKKLLGGGEHAKCMELRT